MPICVTCGQEKDVELFVINKGIRRKQCKKCKSKANSSGKPRTTCFKKGHQPPYAGKKMPPEMVERMREVRRNPNATGRGSYRYQIWKFTVFQRDNCKCVNCGATQKLHAHHIVPWKVDETKRFDVDNGQTLCNSCHSKEETVLAEAGKATRFKKGHKGLKKNGHNK